MCASSPKSVSTWRSCATLCRPSWRARTTAWSVWRKVGVAPCHRGCCRLALQALLLEAAPPARTQAPPNATGCHLFHAWHPSPGCPNLRRGIPATPAPGCCAQPLPRLSIFRPPHPTPPRQARARTSWTAAGPRAPTPAATPSCRCGPMRRQRAARPTPTQRCSRSPSIQALSQDGRRQGQQHAVSGVGLVSHPGTPALPPHAAPLLRPAGHWRVPAGRVQEAVQGRGCQVHW